MADPYIPDPFLQRERGMGGLTPIDPVVATGLYAARMAAAQQMASLALTEAACGVKKEQANRLLEPFSGCDLVVSGNDWDWVLKLRCAPDVDNALRVVAIKMAELLYASKPELLRVGKWSIPLITEGEKALPIVHQLIHSVARCARASYGRIGVGSSLEDDARLVRRLAGLGGDSTEFTAPVWNGLAFERKVFRTSDNLHASPFEHQVFTRVASKNRLGNFDPQYAQLRHLPIYGEVVAEAERLAREVSADG
jgi:hypothetical protein